MPPTSTRTRRSARPGSRPRCPPARLTDRGLVSRGLVGLTVLAVLVVVAGAWLLVDRGSSGTGPASADEGSISADDGPTSADVGPMLSTFAQPNPNTDLAAFGGRLAVEDGCVHLVGSSGPVDVIWPYGFEAVERAGTVVVLDAEGSEVARVGDSIRLGGGTVVSPARFLACRAGTGAVLGTTWPPER